jgi:predicted dehydrogenase
MHKEAVMDDLKAAVVGTGFMGSTHTEALHRLDIDIAGILGSSPQKSRRAAQKLGIPKGYETYDDLLADEDVDVVHITTPNHLHFDQAKAALEAGKHVLCEKPLAITSEETRELVRLAEETGLAAGVNYNLRFYPLNIEARDIVRRGDLGEVHSVAGSYVQDWLLYPTDYNWRVLADKGGKLRAIADIGTHWLDLVQVITGLKVISVFADLHIVHPTRQRPIGEVETFSGKLERQEATETIEVETEDGGAVLIRFENDVPGSLWVSQVTAGRKNSLRYEIAGSERALSWNSEMPNELWNGYRDKANELLHRDPSLLSEAAREYATYPGGHNEGYDDTFKQGFQAFYDYVAEGDMKAPKPFATFEDGHEEVLLCEAILKSDEEERWVELP